VYPKQLKDGKRTAKVNERHLECVIDATPLCLSLPVSVAVSLDDRKSERVILLSCEPSDIAAKREREPKGGEQVRERTKAPATLKMSNNGKEEKGKQATKYGRSVCEQRGKKRNSAYGWVQIGEAEQTRGMNGK